MTVRRRALTLLLPCLALSTSIFVATIARAASDTVVGSGRVQSQTRAVTGFEAIVLRGSMTLVIRQGTRESLELRADDNLLPLVETRVVDRSGVPTLEIGPVANANWRTRSEMKVTVDLVTLKALSVSGAGDVVSEGLRTAALKLEVSGSGDLRLRQLVADELSVKVSGSGDVQTSGRTGRLAISIAGSGDVDTHALESDEVSVTIAGSGDASVTARKSLAVSIAGSGDVSYGGDPAVKTAIAGSGTVKRR